MGHPYKLRQYFRSTAGVLAAVAALSGCVDLRSGFNDCSVERIPGPHLDDSYGDEFVGGPPNLEEAVHPNAAEEMYLQIVSDSEVRLLYERDGKIVVEQYEVESTKTWVE